MSEAAPGIAKLAVGCGTTVMTTLLLIILCSMLLGWGCIEGTRSIYSKYDIKIEEKSK